MLKLFSINSLLKRNIIAIRKMSHKHEDNRLAVFCRVCDEIAEERSYNNKAKILQDFFRVGSNKTQFNGDLLLWVQLLIPAAKQRVYNLQNKQMLKLFSRLFGCDAEQLQLDLEQEGDVSETLRKFFEASKKLQPQKQSTLYLQQVDEFLHDLEKTTKEDGQTDLLRQLCKQTTAQDLKMIVRLIKQDLRINAGARHILDAFGPMAYPVYQSSRDLAAVVKQFGKQTPIKATKTTGVINSKKQAKVSNVTVMTPISPMLASPCKSVEQAFKKNAAGLFGEIKYDGERVQIHKQGNQFKFFSRNLKPVMDHKVKRFEEFIPKAFPEGGDMILDSEIIMVDTASGELLPFGTLGAHKKKEHAEAVVCLFVFDCLLYNGEDITNLAFSERRKILEKHINRIKCHVELSESHFLKTTQELSLLTAKVLKANLEGVVLKSPTEKYNPGKRGWLKIKKDYLFGGKMADTADLVVLGAWFGSGKKGGILSIFLMGCYDSQDRLWKTVTKVHSGLDDASMEKTHKQLMQVMVRADANNLPHWLLCKKALAPDFIASAPEKMPVWEITGAEFTKSDAHTAAGISIRFPRITKIRDDKTAEHANDLQHLQSLFEASKSNVNVDLLMQDCESSVQESDAIELNSALSLTPNKKHKNEAAATTSAESKLKSKSLSKHEDQVISPLKTPNNKRAKLEPAENVVRPQKQLKLSFGTTQQVKVKEKEKDSSRGTLFKDMVAYFSAGAQDAQCMSRFTQNGGTITKDPKAAKTVFHMGVKTENDLATHRSTYGTVCRHLSIQWVNDSLQANKCMSHPPYAVVLKK